MSENRKPLILVTNDDGIFAKGIITLAETMLAFGEVVVVAPDKPQSGMGHAVTINNFLRLLTFALSLPEAAQAHRRTQFQRFGLLRMG